MFGRFEFLVGFRYLKAKKSDTFVSFISFISIVGIALGVAALITVLSVMNGFSKEIRNRIVGVSSHMKVSTLDARLEDWQSINSIVKKNKEVVSSTPFIEGQGLVSINGNITGVILTGVDVAQEMTSNTVFKSVSQDALDNFTRVKFSVLIGKKLARSLGVNVGDKITVMTPNSQVSAVGMMPRIRQFIVAGFFDAKMYEYDMGMVFIKLQDAQILFSMPDLVTGLHIDVKDMMMTGAIKKQLENALPPEEFVTDWIDQHQNYFSAVNLEKKMMAIILFLIVAVASFNLVATLVMNVQNKRSDIAILRTMGASTGNIMRIFILQGAMSGLIGSISGTIIGVILAKNIGHIVHFIELMFHTQLLSSEIYMIDYLPSDIHFADVFMIFGVSVILSVVSTIYPSLKAAKTDPVQSLRYE